MNGAGIRYRFEQVGDVNIFFREAGDPSAPAILLLHGFAASSFMYRDLIPALADRYHVVAPDLPFFGLTDAPEDGRYAPTFANLADTIGKFTEQLGLDRYALVVHDYGAPVGWRLAMAHPSRITALVSQNGNAYEEGLAEGWDAIRRYWQSPTAEHREALRDFPTPASIKWQYLEGVSDASLVAPDGYRLESMRIARPGTADIQLDLVLDYASNVRMYPEFQAYFRKEQPPLLAVWGRNDPYFLPAGAEAWKRDIRAADVRFYDTGHFALETHAGEIVPVIRAFLDKNVHGTAPTGPNLRIDDPTLDQRARALVRIGESGIATENQAALEAFFHPDFRFHLPDGTTLAREDLWGYFAACRAAFDDFTVTRQQIFSDGGDNVAARTTFEGVFVRPFAASPIGPLQPTGRPCRYTINNVFRYAPNGQLIEEWSEYDSRILLHQLGVELIPSNNQPGKAPS